MVRVYTERDIEKLEKSLLNDNEPALEQLRDYRATYSEKLRVGRVMLRDWKQRFTHDNAAQYLLDKSEPTCLQIHLLSKLVTKSWAKNLWLKSTCLDNDIFDWFEKITKPKFRGVVQAINSLCEVKSIQWDWLDCTVQALSIALPQPTRIFANIENLADIFGFSAKESELISFALAREQDSDLCSFIDLLIDVEAHGVDLIARFLNLAPATLAETLNRNSKFRKVMFGSLHDLNISVDPDIKRLLLSKQALTVQQAVGALATPLPDSELTKADFVHLEVDDLYAYLNTCLAQKVVGVNILLYGPSGTGKTQLSRSLAQQCGATLYQVETEENQSNRSRKVGLVQSVLGQTESSILCVDECEDILGSWSYGLSKFELNELLEESTVPVIWITNHIQGFEKSLLRRFDFVLEVDPPSTKQKLALYKHQLRCFNVTDAFCAELASIDVIAQGHVLAALKVTERLGYKGEKAEQSIYRLLENQLKPLGKSLAKQGYVSETQYRPELTNLKGDKLADVKRMLERCQQGRVLLYGPPGTGKTGFAYYLSDAIDMPLQHVRASDLLGPYVGETEQKIAEVFQLAAQNNQILLLDEVDSLLTSREGHVRSWETSQVNELLSQMECFQGILIASTNFQQRLDTAVARRFDFKLAFDYLTAQQAEQLLCEVSRCNSLPKSISQALSTMKKLTPGDFAIVKRRARLSGGLSVNECFELLLKEHSYKTSTETRGIGFLQ